MGAHRRAQEDRGDQLKGSFLTCLLLWVALVPLQGFAQDAASEPEPVVPAEAPEAAEPDPAVVLRAEAERLEAEIGEAIADIRAMNEEARGAKGEDRRVIEKQLMSRKLAVLAEVGQLVDNVVAQEAAGLDAEASRKAALHVLHPLPRAIRTNLNAGRERLDELRDELEVAPAEERVGLTRKVDRQATWVNDLYTAYFEQVGRLEVLGHDVGSERAELTKRLERHAADEAARLELHLEGLRELIAAEGESPQGEAAKQLRALENQRDTSLEALHQATELLGELGVDTTAYDQLVIVATGEVTVDIFRPEVSLGLVRRWVGEAREWITRNGPNVLVRMILIITILAGFWLLSRLLRPLIDRMLDGRRGTSQLMRTVMASLIANSVFVLGVFFALSQLGVEVGHMLAGLGIAGFVVGFALQDSLSNFAAGMMILGYRPYDVGDLIEAGTVFGKVSHMSLVSTTVLTLDNQTLIVPNAKIWGDVIRNVTHQNRRRVDITIRIPYSQDVAEAERLLQGIVDGHPKILDDPAPLVKLHGLGEYAMEIVTRSWTATSDYWEVHWDVTRAAKDAFDAAGISLAVPQAEVRVVGGAGAER